MSIETYVAIGFVIVAAILIGIRMYKSHNKDFNEFEIDDFISNCTEDVIRVLRSAILILKVNISDYNTQEEYEDAIINETYKQITENVDILGIPAKYLDFATSDLVKECIKRIFNCNKVKAFVNLDTDTIIKHEEIMDTNVVNDRVDNK